MARPKHPVRMGIYGLLTAGFTWAFYERYWRLRDCFNEQGRCYDPVTQQVITDGAAFWGVLATLFAALFLLHLVRRGDRA